MENPFLKKDRTRLLLEWCKSLYRAGYASIPMGWRLGSQYRRLVNQLIESQWWSSEQLAELQNRKLQRLIRHCYEKVPYYRQVMKKQGLKPDDIRSSGDLAAFPLLNKSKVKEHYEELKADDFELWNAAPAHSGGTSGDNLVLLLGRSAYLAERACYVRRYSWAGYHEGDRCVYLRDPLNLKQPDGSPRLWYFKLDEKWLQMETLGLSDEYLAKLVAKMKAYKTKVISAYPSNMEILARYILDNHIRIPTVRSVITSSETVHPWHRTLARRAFGSDIYDWYGQAEHVASAAQCEQGSYHINAENVVVEIIDSSGKAVVEGSGIIAGTCLDNYAQPLIRYDTGDLAAVTRKPCPCRRQLPILESLHGRVWDSFLRADGTPLSTNTLGVRLNPILDRGELGRIQIVQISPEAIEVLVERDSRFCEATLETLLRALRAETKIDTITARFVTTIPKTRTGKHPLFRRVLSPDHARDGATAFFGDE